MKIQRVLAFLFLILSVTIMGACGKPEAPKQEENTNTENTPQVNAEEKELYIFIYFNEDTKRVFVQNVPAHKQEELEYNGGTYIKDRYGTSTTVDRIQSGELVNLTLAEGSNRLLKEISVSDQTFELDNVTGFAIDLEKMIFTADGKSYYYDEALKVFSGDKIASLNDLIPEDTICIRGEDKQIYTMAVLKGHGRVILKNTGPYEGGMLEIGTITAKVITHNMEFFVPEGTYTFSASKDGSGGSMAITVERFKDIVINMDELK